MSDLEERDSLRQQDDSGDIQDAVLLQIEGVEPEKAPEIEKVRHYFVTTVSGLEDVALQDMKRHLKALAQVRVERRQRHSRIFFHYERSPRRLLELRCVDNLFVLLAMVRGITVGRPGLLRIAEQVARADLIPGIALHDTLHGPGEDPWFSLTCTGGRQHRFSASELHQVVQTVVEAKYGIPTEGESMPYSLHLHVEGKNAVFGLQLSPKRMRDRDYRVQSVPGGLESTVGYCMAFLARVEKRDVCLDPMCGGGTTLVEAGLGFEPAGLLGGDIQADALQAARANAAAGGAQVRFARWDAARLPLGPGSVDKVLCNLPYGKKTVFSGAAAIGTLLQELARVLRRGRVAVLLCDHREAMREALEKGGAPFELLRELPIHLGGLKPSLYVLKRQK